MKKINYPSLFDRVRPISRTIEFESDDEKFSFEYSFDAAGKFLWEDPALLSDEEKRVFEEEWCSLSVALLTAKGEPRKRVKPEEVERVENRKNELSELAKKSRFHESKKNAAWKIWYGESRKYTEEQQRIELLKQMEKLEISEGDLVTCISNPYEHVNGILSISSHGGNYLTVTTASGKIISDRLYLEEICKPEKAPERKRAPIELYSPGDIFLFNPGYHGKHYVLISFQDGKYSQNMFGKFRLITQAGKLGSRDESFMLTDRGEHYKGKWNYETGKPEFFKNDN